MLQVPFHGLVMECPLMIFEAPLPEDLAYATSQLTA